MQKNASFTLATLLFFLFTLLPAHALAQRIPASLAQYRWILTEIRDGKGTSAITNDHAYLEFDARAKRAFGKGGCNNFSMSASTKGRRITFKAGMSTEMYCENTMWIEDRFLPGLETMKVYEIQNDRLLLKNPQSGHQMTFIRRTKS